MASETMTDNDEIIGELRWQITTLHNTINCLQDIITELEGEVEEEETVTVESEPTTTLPKIKVELPRLKNCRGSPVPRVTPKRRRSSFRKSTPKSHNPTTFLGVHDSENHEIHVGDTVQFLSSGKFTSKTGIVYKVDGKLQRVTARDRQKNCVTRAPKNLKVTKISIKRS